MDIGLILKVAGVGFLVSVACQVLSRTGRDEQVTLISLAGVIIVLLMLTPQIGELFDTIKGVFGI